ncbi:pilus assembly protein TadG-related protein [Streptomyces sp. NPDC096080]|uniref:pilus assembly protein TadG-related protein n=1 Tax=Streptomyces sp. NPDC096080 TaxID=3156693 RepID=UPI0033245682
MRLRHDDAGQAFPIYITVVGGLLFLAFAYLAVGQAAASRNSTQTAADAAALAAAQDTRDVLAGEWVRDVLDPTKWGDLLDGDAAVLDGCARAYQLAGRNGSHVLDCAPRLADLSYTVRVQKNDPVGDTIVPGTEGTYAKASAKAVIEPLCTFVPPTGGGEDTDDPGDPADIVLPKLTCKDRNWDLDPEHRTELPEPKDLFDVHLAD